MPNGTKGGICYTRYQHSLGVARLAWLYCDARDLEFSERRTVCVAALLHDLGHAPLSHSLEPVFKEFFGLEHHRATEDVLCGRTPLGRDICNILRHNRVDIDRVTALISGKEPGHDGLFCGPINFDTIEGILRTQQYATPNAITPSQTTMIVAAIERRTKVDQELVDQFWLYKDSVYKYVINLRRGILADYVCQLFMRRQLNEVMITDCFATEGEIFRKLRGLRELLTSRSFEAEAERYIDQPIVCKARRFFINESSDFFKRGDLARYQQTRLDCVVLPKDLSLGEVEKLERDLFDEDTISRNLPSKSPQQ